MVASGRKMIYTVGTKITARSRQMFLVGNQQHMLDDKNRIRLPQKFREEIGNNKYILMPGTGGCMFVYPQSE